MLLDPPAHSDWRSIYRLLTGLVVPRPIAWVSTVSESGVLNLAPFSFFNVVCPNPPVVVVCPMVSGRTGRTKDTLNNVRAVPEFVLQIVSYDLMEAMNLCSGEFAAEVNEFDVSGLTAIPSHRLKVPRVAEARAWLECRVRDVITISDAPGGSSLILGDVVFIEVRDEILSEGRVCVDKLDAVGRLAGADYCRLDHRFSLERPEPEALGRPGRV